MGGDKFTKFDTNARLIKKEIKIKYDAVLFKNNNL